ncbi:unnamed protein product [Protopolystoma xenopodis]|uniref:Uncharacterized protein n=1 Tax=Protopolystoma xenopodis TaxID=117903 RepID=A0A3S5A573_9PLAT|nr:unnamed protein product [Protopolystoma xenopodis]
MEPEVPGVGIYEVATRLNDISQLDQRDYDSCIRTMVHTGLAASINGASGTRHTCLRTALNPHSYAFDSDTGRLIIELRALTPRELNDLHEPIRRPFKLNFQLVL